MRRFFKNNQFEILVISVCAVILCVVFWETNQLYKVNQGKVKSEHRWHVVASVLGQEYEWTGLEYEPIRRANYVRIKTPTDDFTIYGEVFIERE